MFNPNVPGLKLIGRYGANAQHTLFYIVERGAGPEGLTGAARGWMRGADPAVCPPESTPRRRDAQRRRASGP